MKTVRCAIYTRKSSEDGLEQGFNSLHAQREACAAYVLSQASEGWTLIADEYDDGGLSGGTLERPALQRLLADVAAGKVDIIVLYKIDRLTRSLLDFAKLVEALDAAGTSFVSITQSFNTTTSMGRLTLNMLLSFAQFEREVTAERIRDKISASKAKGMWMGGVPPLGYAPHGRSLAIVEEHAAIVRDIHARYLRLGNVRLVADELVAAGITTPPRTSLAGRRFGGRPFSRGQLYAILRNAVYVGEIAHRGKRHPGLHPSLLEREAWEAVQRKLDGNARGEHRRQPKAPAPLAGKVFDADGAPLITVHTTKGAVRYRYYVSKALHAGAPASEGDPTRSGLRIPARELEEVVAGELATLLDDPLDLPGRLGVVLAPPELKPLLAAARTLGAQLHAGDGALLSRLVTRVEVLASSIAITLAADALAAALGLAPPAGDAAAAATPTPAPASALPSLILTVPVRLTRTGRAVRLVHGNGSLAHANEPDLALIRLLAKARTWWSLIASGSTAPGKLARVEGVSVSWLLRVLRLAFLSPTVTTAILDGKLKAGIDATTLLDIDGIALDWQAQEQAMVG